MRIPPIRLNTPNLRNQPAHTAPFAERDEKRKTAFPGVFERRYKKGLVDDLTGLYHSLSNDYFLVKYADSNNHEEYFMKFVTDLRKIMDRVGMNESAYDHLPSPTYKKM
jgi:hypothetical protein